MLLPPIDTSIIYNGKVRLAKLGKDFPLIEGMLLFSMWGTFTVTKVIPKSRRFALLQDDIKLTDVDRPALDWTWPSTREAFSIPVIDIPGLYERTFLLKETDYDFVVKKIGNYVKVQLVNYDYVKLVRTQIDNNIWSHFINTME